MTCSNIKPKDLPKDCGPISVLETYINPNIRPIIQAIQQSYSAWLQNLPNDLIERIFINGSTFTFEEVANISQLIMLYKI